MVLYISPPPPLTWSLSYNALIFLLEHGQIISSIQSYKIFLFNLIGILLSHKTPSDEATLGPKGALAPEIFEKQLVDNIIPTNLTIYKD